MNKNRYRWVIVAAGGLLGCVAIGAMFSLPVFIRPISRDTGWSITGISSAMTFGFLAMALGSIVWGNLSDRFGPRLVVLTGSGVLAGALALASRASIAHRVSIDIRLGGRRRDRGHLCAHDGLRDRLVRHSSEPRGVPRFRRHGDGANDHVSFGGAAHLQPRLENVPANSRRARRWHHDSGALLVRRPPALNPEIAALAAAEEPRSDITLSAGDQIAAIHHAAADQFFLLCHALRPDLPYGELRDNLRNPADRRGVDLQRGRAGGLGRPRRVRLSRRPVWSETRSGLGPAAAGVRRTGLFLRA